MSTDEDHQYLHSHVDANSDIELEGHSYEEQEIKGTNVYP
jgi:hypothetical protein